jgi:glycolate oxidase
MSSKITPAVLAELEAAVGSLNAFSDQDRISDYGHDEFSMREIAHEPDLVVRPATTWRSRPFSGSPIRTASR